MNNTKLTLLIIIASALIVLLEVYNFWLVGETVNTFFPCEQNPPLPLPCYWVYDVVVIFIWLDVFLSLIIMLLFRIYKRKKSSNL